MTFENKVKNEGRSLITFTIVVIKNVVYRKINTHRNYYLKGCSHYHLTQLHSVVKTVLLRNGFSIRKIQKYINLNLKQMKTILFQQRSFSTLVGNDRC